MVFPLTRVTTMRPCGPTSNNNPRGGKKEGCLGALLVMKIYLAAYRVNCSSHFLISENILNLSSEMNLTNFTVSGGGALRRSQTGNIHYMPGMPAISIWKGAQAGTWFAACVRKVMGSIFNAVQSTLVVRLCSLPRSSCIQINIHEVDSWAVFKRVVG